MNYLQRLGKSLMLPVSVMPIAALLKGIGYWIDPFGWGSNNLIAAFLIESGTAIIDNLPLLFAVGIAIGMIQEKEYHVTLTTEDYDEIAILLLEALGGRSNIIFVDSCITRLRVELKDINLVNEQEILATGATGIVKVGKSSIQIIIGTEVGFIVDSINDILM